MPRTSQVNERLYAYFQENKILSQENLRRAADFSVKEHVNLDRAIMALGLIEEETLLSVLAKQIGIPFTQSTDGLKCDHDTLNTLTPEFCKANAILPVMCDGMKQPTFLMALSGC